MKFARLLVAAIGLLPVCLCFAQNLTGVSFSSNQVPAGTPVLGTVTLSAPAGVGGVTVNLFTPSQAATFNPSVTVGQGSTQATFTINTHNFGYTKLIAAITASYNSVDQLANLTVTPGNYSSFIAQSVPSAMVCGQSYPVTVQFKNTGTRLGMPLISTNSTAATRRTT